MARVKIKMSGTKVSLWVRFSFGEKIDIGEYANIIANGYYGLVKPESIKGANIYYESFSGRSLKEVLTTNLSRNDIVRIVEQILLVLLEVEEFGLPKDSVLMDLNNIYIDSSTNEIKMLCSSAVACGKNKSVSNLIYEILNTYATKETSNLNFRRRFFDYLDKLEDADIYRIEDFLVAEKRKIVLEVRDIYYTRLYEKMKEKYGEIQRVDAIKRKIDLEKAKMMQEKHYERSKYVDDDEPTGFAETNDNEPMGYASQEEDDEPTGFYDTEKEDDEPTGFYDTEKDDDEPTGFYDVEKDDDEPTGFFNTEDHVDTYSDATLKKRQESTKQSKIIVDKSHNNHDNPVRLIRKSSGETIYINKLNFRLGREDGSVDYCISDNKKISRAHADIIFRGSQWYIVDLKSKNRTFLNDRVLQASVEAPLHDGDVIKLNNEEFVFLLK